MQRLRWVKRYLLAPFPSIVLPWATRPPASAAKALALRRLVMPKLRADGRPFEKKLDDGRTFRGNTRDLLGLFVYVFEVWEPNLTAFIEARLKPGEVFVDVGANLGWFSILAGRLVGPVGTVVAIEASPLLAGELRRNVEANRLSNVRILNAAAGAEAGTVDVVHGPAENAGLTRVRKGATVRRDTLQAFIDGKDLPLVRLIKIDVEGAEYDVIKGFTPALGQLSASAEVIIEVDPESARGPEDVRVLFDSFERAGFHPYALPNSYYPKGYLLDPVPDSLARIDRIPTVQTDVVFSRPNSVSLPVR